MPNSALATTQQTTTPTAARSESTMRVLDHQWFGTIWYERGLEVLEVQGWFRGVEVCDVEWIFVYADPEVDCFEQRFTSISSRRVIEMDVEDKKPLPRVGSKGTIATPPTLRSRLTSAGVTMAHLGLGAGLALVPSPLG